MLEINYWAVAVAVVAALVVSTAWYAAWSMPHADVIEAVTPSAYGRNASAWKALVEVGRTLAVAVVLAGLATELGVTTWTGAVWLALAAWIGFPVVILTGSALWEHLPWRLAAIHASNWLVTLLLVSCIVALWR
jgi:hypothetical protein